MESLSFFVFVLSRSYPCLYLFYRDLSVVWICFIESLSLFVFVLWRAYRCLHLFLSRAYRLYLLFTCDVGEIENDFRVNTIPLPVFVLCMGPHINEI